MKYWAHPIKMLDAKTANNTESDLISLGHVSRSGFALYWNTGATGGQVKLYGEPTARKSANPQVIATFDFVAGDQPDSRTFDEAFQFVWAKITSAITGAANNDVTLTVQGYTDV